MFNIHRASWVAIPRFRPSMSWNLAWRLFNIHHHVQVEHDHNNVAKTLEAPPIMLAELVKMWTDAFIRNVLDPFRQHLEKFWSTEQIDQVECDHKDMLLAYDANPQSREFWMLTITKRSSMMRGTMSKPASLPCANFVADLRLCSQTLHQLNRFLYGQVGERCTPYGFN